LRFSFNFSGWKSDYNEIMMTVQLFITCLVDSFYPQTGEAVVSILRHLGLTVDFPPDQTCCGQPPFNAGLRAEARPIVEHTIRVFEKTDGDIVDSACMSSPSIL
jgi:L-lactate dehydrogenase complex protein LldE